jgi:hypothetical protein
MLGSRFGVGHCACYCVSNCAAQGREVLAWVARAPVAFNVPGATIAERPCPRIVSNLERSTEMDSGASITRSCSYVVPPACGQLTEGKHVQS